MSKILVNCSCGRQLKKKQKKYCSLDCLYIYRIRPRRPRYTIKTQNKSWRKKGEDPWNKGKKGLQVAWNKGVKGIHLSQETEFKKGNNMGEKNINWKGGITSENMLLRHSPEYRAWRKAVFERDNYTCQNCFMRGGRLEADHIKPWSLFLKLRFEIDNGRTLCEECHELIGWKKSYSQEVFAYV